MPSFPLARSRLEDVNVLKKYVPDLAVLDLSNNPICMHKTYKTLLLRRLPKLLRLDCEDITKADREAASDNTSTLTVQVRPARPRSGTQFSSACASEPETQRAGCRSSRITLTAAAVPALLLLALLQVPRTAMTPLGGGMLRRSLLSTRGACSMVHVTALGCSDSEGAAGFCFRVRRIQNMEKLTSLRRASFADNELTRLEGLDQCTALEELSVEDNRIMSIDGLSRCIALKKLELGKNKICQIENLEMLTALTQLSVEDNEIETLTGIATLRYLMELYIGNNRVRQLREVLNLKDLPKLIIVDLLGNPLCKVGNTSISAS